MMLISVLSTGIMFHYTFSLKSTIYKSQELKAIRDKKQALELAQVAFSKLKSVASEDACFMYTKGSHLYFKDQKTIDCKLGFNAGYCVNGNFEAKIPFACRFDKQGLRKSLAEILKDENRLANINGKAPWELAKKRWEAFEHKESLPPNIFPPLLWKAEMFEENKIKWLLVHFINPYDRKLQTGEMHIEGFCVLPCTSGIWFCAHCADPQQRFQIFGVEPNISFRIKNGYEYNIPTTCKELVFGIEGNREEGFCFKPNPTIVKQAPKQGKKSWRRQPKLNPAPASNTANKNSFKNLFPTKTWLDRLNACFFGYNPKEPLSTIENFRTKHEGVSVLRNYFWNSVVANPTADVFYFNGSKIHIEEKLRAYGVPPDRIYKIAKEIVKYQPYASATAFLEKVVKFPEIKNILHHFEHLSHRAEKFKIESWYGEYVCEMIVQREAVNDIERDWKLICVHLRKRKIKNSIF